MAASGWETGVVRAVVKAGQWAAGKASARINSATVRVDSRALTGGSVSRDALAELTDEQTAELTRFLASPEFDEIALQLVLARLLDDRSGDETRSAVRDQIRHGVTLRLHTEPHQSTILADVLFDALLAAAQLLPESVIGSGRRADAVTAATVAHLTAAATANSRLLRDLPALTGIRTAAAELRRQHVALYRDMHLPHIGASRKVPYSDLYVAAPLVLPTPYMDGAERTLNPARLAEPMHRYVVLGSPGAGKSTLLAKLAHDIAADRIPELTGRVPFLVTLRRFEAAFRSGERPLAGYLEAVCKDPCNVVPPPGAVEYLLRNGRAVVLLDGLDELVDQALRVRVTQLVEAFAHQHPLTPIVVTARIIGYDTAPLDRNQFPTVTLRNFRTEQVEDYATRWFRLDDATPVPQRAELTRSFLAESATAAAELRSSPLLLALLCAMYSAEHYIPRNAAQIYEKCALMLFERWDSMRGIGMPLQFRGRVRGAVQYLAWLQLNAPGQAPLTESHIVGELTRYLERRHLDPDEAQATAEDFLTFCTGRSWILTDVGGATYGFTHRTFMEYFAAEHMVRTHRTAEALWDALASKISEGAWDVVGQVVLQLYDRNVEDGADEILRLLLDRDPDEQQLTFAARALGQVTPTPPTVTAIAARATELLLAQPIAAIAPYFRPERYDPVRGEAPFHELLHRPIRENVPAIRSGIDSSMIPALDRGRISAVQVAGLHAWRPIDAGATPESLYRYLAHVGADPPALVAPDSFSEPLMKAPTPWISALEWSAAITAAGIWEDWPDEMESRFGISSLREAILLLPYLESDVSATHRSPNWSPLATTLLEARAHRRVPDLGESDEARFLARWASGEFSVIG